MNPGLANLFRDFGLLLLISCSVYAVGPSMALAAPRICCLDLDTFFVSVERLLDPRLIGKPVVVGGLPRQRGVVTSASYEVRALGVRSGMSLTRAFELAPQRRVPADAPRRVRRLRAARAPDRRERTRRFRRSRASTRCSSTSPAARACTGCPATPTPTRRSSASFAQLTAEIRGRVGLPASAGIATSRSVAKVASGLAKPRRRAARAGGQRKRSCSVRCRCASFPASGRSRSRSSHALGLTTLADVAAAPTAVLRRIFGAWAESIQRGCRGLGAHELGRERPAFQEHDPEGCAVGTISNERTFREDVRDPASIDAMLCSLCERVCWRARKRGVKARTVTLKLRYADFQTLTRSRTITPTCSELELYPVVSRPVRSRAPPPARDPPARHRALNLGTYDEQLSLFDDGRALHRAVDGIRKRYGYDALRIALTVSRRRG